MHKAVGLLIRLTVVTFLKAYALVHSHCAQSSFTPSTSSTWPPKSLLKRAVPCTSVYCCSPSCHPHTPWMTATLFVPSRLHYIQQLLYKRVHVITSSYGQVTTYSGLREGCKSADPPNSTRTTSEIQNSFSGFSEAVILTCIDTSFD